MSNEPAPWRRVSEIERANIASANMGKLVGFYVARHGSRFIDEIALDTDCMATTATVWGIRSAPILRDLRAALRDAKSALSPDSRSTLAYVAHFRAQHALDRAIRAGTDWGRQPACRQFPDSTEYARQVSARLDAQPPPPPTASPSASKRTKKGS